MESLGIRQQRQVYLITYSRANLSAFPTRQSFATAIINAFETTTVAKVLHWVVAVERHNDDCEEDHGSHYHMAVKLSKKTRWANVRSYIDKEFEIQVNFSSVHSTYYSAYRYTVKEDTEPLLSDDHPDLNDSHEPRTEKAINARKRKKKQTTKKAARKRMSVYDVTQLVQTRGITSRLQLVAFAVQQNRNGKTNLAEFIANRGARVVDEALQLAREFAEAEGKLARSKKTRLELLNEAYAGECASECRERWLQCAIKLIESNGIALSHFCGSIHTALQLGRAKYQNIYVHGPANAGKTFILSPLKCIYQAFCNPATGTFAWVGAEQAEIIMLNDFRWNPSIIAWSDFLQLLEGDIVHLPAPKNFCSRDIEFTKDTPFFATADAPLVLVKGGSIDQANSQMMSVRWRFFHFWKQIPEKDQLRLNPCPKCFARLILDNK